MTPPQLKSPARLSCVVPHDSLFVKTHAQSLISAGVLSASRSKTAALTDSRIRTMNEVVSGIRIIKMYAWEKPFAALVSDVRRYRHKNK